MEEYVPEEFNLAEAVPPEPKVTVHIDTSGAEVDMARLHRLHSTLAWQHIGEQWAVVLHRQRWRSLMATVPYYRA